ncbi:NAD(P)/FAD-dependent oxidoreductase [Geminicoccus flavidas]|uniref:NAD(P)/FAD-dependent oxidoreductase n=1 Tax=Geminicoccus flavidas TaxID=2506407 RepID=UPI0013591E94|nr:FAD-dependent oxidoreductase [Geminicoccus flavidas]
MLRVEVAVVGGGIAGASAAARIAPHRSVCLLEREAQPGSHASGRSATMFATTYGNQLVRRLALASHAFLADAGHPGGPLLHPRGMLHVASPSQEALLAAFADQTGLAVLAAGDVLDLVPILRPEAVIGGVLDHAAAAIDDHRFLQLCLRSLKAAGGTLRCNAEVIGIEPTGSGYRLVTSAGPVEADLVVNAAGAWADELARLAGVPSLGLKALRRTAVTVDPPPGSDPSGWPMAIDIAETWYFKPEGGRLLLSPADATEVPPHDVQAEEWDVAVAIDRYACLTGHEPGRIHHRWAGLRSFVSDHSPVVGCLPGHDRFLWLAGQGGAGFMTAPALAEVAAALVTGRDLTDELRVLLAELSPARLATFVG